MVRGPSWREILVEALGEHGTRELAVESVVALEEQSPLVRGDADLRDLAMRSSAANVEFVADLVRGAATLDEYELPAPVAAFARELARRNVPMTELALAYRVAQHVMWRFGVDALRRRETDTQRLAGLVEA